MLATRIFQEGTEKTDGCNNRQQNVNAQTLPFQNNTAESSEFSPLVGYSSPSRGLNFPRSKSVRCLFFNLIGNS